VFGNRYPESPKIPPKGFDRERPTWSAIAHP